MNKKNVTLLCLLVSCGQVFGQVAKWIVQPEYECIYKEMYADVLRGESSDGRTTIWSMDGGQLLTTDDHITVFREGRAVTSASDKVAPYELIKEIYTVEGQPCSVSGNYWLLPNADFFSSGHLLVLDDSKDNAYRFMSPDGNVSGELFVEAKPFINGYATCETFEKWEKKKGRFRLLLNKDMEQVTLSYKGKVFDENDVNFISSVNDEGIGIVVADEKVFFFNGKNGTLSPLYSSDQESNLKNQVIVKGDFLAKDDAGKIHLKAHTRKTEEEVIITLDSLLIPLSIKSDLRSRVFQKKEDVLWNPQTSLSLTEKQNLYGIQYTGKIEVLPPQFKDVQCYGDKAIVVLQNGRCGVLQVLGNKDFSLILNDGEDIPFKHRRFKTSLYLDMPNDISPDNVRVVIDPNSGCSIDERTKEQRETDAGNRVQYQCMLNFPESLPDEMLYDDRNKLIYPVRILYHGLESPVKLIEAYAWHYKYFALEPSDVQVSSDGTATFSLNIVIPSSEDQNYSLQVGISSSDTLNTEITSYNVFKHKCTVSPLNEGINNIDIIVKEEGCPPITLPFELSYTKPVPRRRESAKVSIIQKTKQAPKQFIPKT